MQALILAGGKGTRLMPLTQDKPKSMVRVNGRPFLEHQIKLLKSSGVEDFVLCVGYKSEAIEEYFGDGGPFGVRISYSHDGPEPLGPAGAIKRAQSLVKESFFVTYGDAFLRAPYGEVMKALLDSDKLALMTVYKNENRFGLSDLMVEGGLVIRYDKSGRSGNMEWINFGVSALRKAALDLIPEGECTEETFYGGLIAKRQLLAFPVSERFYEIGTPASLTEFEQFLKGRAWTS